MLHQRSSLSLHSRDVTFNLQICSIPIKIQRKQKKQQLWLPLAVLFEVVFQKILRCASVSRKEKLMKELGKEQT